MPVASALSTGSLHALVSIAATAIPSALEETAALVAFTMSATTELSDPVHWYLQPSSAQASAAPYWVGTKNGLVVTWLTNTKFHLGVVANWPTPGDRVELQRVDGFLDLRIDRFHRRPPTIGV